MRGVARGSTANLIGAAITAIANFAVTIAVTRALDKPAAGVFFSVTSLFLLATSLGQLGTDTGLVYFISRCRALGTTKLVHTYMRTATRPVVVMGLFTGLAVFVLARPLADITNHAHIGAATTYLRVLAVFIPIAGLESVALSATAGLGTMRPSALIEQVGRPVLQIMLTVGALVLIPKSGVIGAAWALPYVLAAAAAWWSWRRRLAALHRRIITAADDEAAADAAHDESGLARRFWRFTAPRTLASVIQVAIQRFDIVLVGALAGAATAAVYAASTRFVVAGQMGSMAVSRAVRPRIGAALARNDQAETKLLYRMATAWLVVVTWPLYLLLLVFGTRVLSLLGHGYGAGNVVLVILSLSMMIANGCGMVDVVLAMAGRTSWNLYNVAVACAVNLGLDLWLIPTHGLLGAAIGWGAAIILQNVVPLVQTSSVLRLHPFGAATTVAYLLPLVCFGAAPLGVRLALGPSWLGLLAGIGLGSVLYLAGLWRFRRVLELAALRALRPGHGRSNGSKHGTDASHA